MKLETLVAKKYFFPKNRDFFRRISLISILTVFISVFLPLFVLGILNGFHQAIIDKMISKDFHIHLFDSKDAFFEYRDVKEAIEKKYPTAKAFPYFEGAGILSGNQTKLSALIRGIPQDMVPFLSDYQMLSGEWKINATSIMLGASLAQKLKVKSGDILQIFVKPYENKKSDRELPLLSKKFKIAGIFQTGYEEIDGNLVFMDFLKAKSLYDYGDRAWAMGFYLQDVRFIPQIKKDLKEMNFFYRIRDWEEANKNMLFSFQWEKNIMLFVLVLIIAATLFSVYIAFNVVVADRKKEIALLRTIGLTTQKIEKIFFFKGLFISLLGGVLGFLFAFLALYNLKEILYIIESGLNPLFNNLSLISKESSYSKNFNFSWGFKDMAVVFGLNFFAVFLATHYPIKRLNKTSMAENMRNV